MYCSLICKSGHMQEWLEWAIHYKRQTLTVVGELLQSEASGKMVMRETLRRWNISRLSNRRFAMLPLLVAVTFFCRLRIVCYFQSHMPDLRWGKRLPIERFTTPKLSVWRFESPESFTVSVQIHWFWSIVRRFIELGTPRSQWSTRIVLQRSIVLDRDRNGWGLIWFRPAQTVRLRFGHSLRFW